MGDIGHGGDFLDGRHQLSATIVGDSVVAAKSTIDGLLAIDLDVPVSFESVDCSVQRTDLGARGSLGEGLDLLEQAVTVLRAARENRQNPE